ncbi:hypothetical protein NC651_025726 [Populus alba x Populus x berolinensis]|nr:hypothetical protein NC651_025726 [Populus alba x Populus x berolinensis]
MNLSPLEQLIIPPFNQFNPKKKPKSENPGSMKIPTAVFGCGIKEELLEKAFGLKGKDISKVRKKFLSC